MKKAFQMGWANVQQKFSVPDLEERWCQLAAWYRAPQGQAFLVAERAVVEQALSRVFGYHLLEMSSAPGANFAASTRISHSFSVVPDIQAVTRSHMTDASAPSVCSGQANNVTALKAKAAVVASGQQLPLADESIDVTILHHTLEFSANPHQLLKEAARVTIARGHIVIIGFNPLSGNGLVRPFKQLFSSQTIWQRHSITANRLRDWLTFLDCSCVSTQYRCHHFAWRHSKKIASSHVEDLSSRFNLPFGASYCILARKDKLGMTPIKPLWQNNRLSIAFPHRSFSSKTPLKARGDSKRSSRFSAGRTRQRP